MKKLYYLFITLALFSILGLTACSSSQTTTTDGDGSDTTSIEEQPVLVGDASAGAETYKASCLACHGEDGVGIEGLGKDMTTSEFIYGKTDVELVAFIKVGRPNDDPLNTTGVPMPAKGGNPSLTDQDLFNVVAYMRSIQK